MENSFPLFEVPTVSPEMNQEEMILQIANSLDYLSSVSDAVFDCILSGINQKRSKIDEINKRADLAKAKIEKLTGSKSATKVFSSAKYPAGDAYKHFTSIFSGVEKLPHPARDEIYRPIKKATNETSINEKLQFFHVRSKSKMLKRNVDIVLKEGLGPVPNDCQSVSSLLLFNTTESPYKNYTSLDPMKVASKIKTEDREDKKFLDDPPQSIALGEQLSALTPESYLYSPSLGEVPVLDLPLDLPDLPGIADDLRYCFDIGPGFAPSVASTPSMPDLPNILPDVQSSLPSPSQSKKTAGSEVVVMLPPPPPPPPPPPLAPPSPPLQIQSIPPPPPPPTMNENLPASVSTAPERPSPAAALDNGRSSLMDAIRKAGGSTKAKLRSVRENQDELRRKKEETAIAAGGDLMADLHNRLLMRRKGISGDKPGSGSVMDKISAMIPPPPAHQDTSSATEDDDWDSDT